MTGRYPFDIDELYKGQHISFETLQDAIGINQAKDPEKFQLAALGIQAWIHQQREVTCVLRKGGKGGLDILTDEEAAAHNHKLIQESFRAGIFRHAKNLEVEVENLSPQRRVEHDRNLARDGRLLNAMRNEQKLIRLETVKSKQLKTPKKPPGKAGKDTEEQNQVVADQDSPNNQKIH